MREARARAASTGACWQGGRRSWQGPWSERDHGGREVLLDLLETALETTKHLAKLQPFPSKQRFRLKKFRGYRRNRAEETFRHASVQTETLTPFRSDIVICVKMKVSFTWFKVV